MDGQLGKQYLQDYLSLSSPLFDAYLQRKIKDASKIGKIPVDLLKRFLETARRGKKIRGALTILGYEACGGHDKEAILDASLSIELLHAGLLVHDDFIDEDKLRRGLPSLHEQFAKLGKEIKVKSDFDHYGEAMAVTAGDTAFYLAWEALLDSAFPPEKLVAAGKVLAAYVVRTTYGQGMDITNTPLTSLNQDHLLSVLRLKSAEYTSILPLLLGATLAGESKQEKLKALESYGLAFGWAFQIQDDILGMFGSEEKVGKPIGSDLREGKNTLLMLHLHQHGTPAQKAFQKKVLGNKHITAKDVEKMRQILLDAGSYQYVLDLGWKYVAKGKKQISLITTDDKLQDILKSLIIYMMERVK